MIKLESLSQNHPVYVHFSNKMADEAHRYVPGFS